MPNWTHVTIAIHLPDLNDATQEWGDNFATRLMRWEVFRNLKNAIQDSNGEPNEVFNILRPMPNNEWSYDWCCRNWGTKWDLNSPNCELKDNGIIILDGTTAWSPPHALLAYLCEDLGFDVECQHHSFENNEWGYYQNQDEESFELNCPYIDIDDEDDRVALRIQEIIEEHPNEGRDMIMWKYLGCDAEQPDYNYLCDDWLVDDTEYECMELDEKFEEWEHKWGSRKETLREMKHKLLEQLESYLEVGIIDEGNYLKTCNYMKNINDLDIFTMFEKGVRMKSTHKIEMINHYNNKPEPPLILMYS